LETHPFSVLRAAALTQWVDSGGYGAVLTGDYPSRSYDGNAGLNDDLSAAAKHYKDGFDQSQDPFIRGIRDGLTGIVDGVGHAATNVVDSVGRTIRKIPDWRRNAEADD
jgi:hypothetical protein